jgi:phage FluMu protein Com
MSIDVGQRNKTSAEKILQRIDSVGSTEVVVFCPGCKALETLYFNESQLIPTRKYAQKMGGIYHACGSNEPCRLYSLS